MHMLNGLGWAGLPDALPLLVFEPLVRPLGQVLLVTKLEVAEFSFPAVVTVGLLEGFTASVLPLTETNATA
jgi:hypothetical protein